MEERVCKTCDFPGSLKEDPALVGEPASRKPADGGEYQTNIYILGGEYHSNISERHWRAPVVCRSIAIFGREKV